MNETRLRTSAQGLIDWTLSTALPLWWERGADRTKGGFFELLEQNGAPADRPRRARVQARQIYCFAASSALGDFSAAQEAVNHGLDFFVSRYRRPDGLFRTLVANDGAPLDDRAFLYDQAFALLALAEAHRSQSGRTDLVALADETLQSLQSLRTPAGGFRETSEDQPFQSNPHMHLFEAALAWEEVDGGKAWSALADEIGDLSLGRFIDASGALHEFFSGDWSLASGVSGRIVEPGHQFEWAWLLRRWGRRRGREDAILAAARMFEIGLRHGVDVDRGVAVDQLLDDMSVHSGGARLWPQTERVKAAVSLFEDETDPTRKESLALETVKALEGLGGYLDLEVPGLWRDKMTPDGVFVEEPAPASSFYHIVCAAIELRRALGRPG